MEAGLMKARVKLNPTTISSHTQRRLLVLVIHYARGSETFTYLQSEKETFDHDRKILEAILKNTNIQPEEEPPCL